MSLIRLVLNPQASVLDLQHEVDPSSMREPCRCSGTLMEWLSVCRHDRAAMVDSKVK
jgi:hypothetical protein